MVGNRLAVLVLITVLLCSLRGVAGAESMVSVTPNGVVNLTEENGRVIRLTTSVPLKPGCMMETNDGTCIVQGPKFGLTAQDKSRFTFLRAGDKWVMVLDSGRVRYILRQGPPIKFAHGDAVYELAKITPAEAGGNVTGLVAVVGDKLEFVNEDGELALAPTIGGIAEETVVAGPAAGGMSTATAIGAAAAGVGAVGAGAAMGLSSGKSTTSRE